MASKVLYAVLGCVLGFCTAHAFHYLFVVGDTLHAQANRTVWGLTGPHSRAVVRTAEVEPLASLLLMFFSARCLSRLHLRLFMLNVDVYAWFCLGASPLSPPLQGVSGNHAAVGTQAPGHRAPSSPD